MEIAVSSECNSLVTDWHQEDESQQLCFIGMPLGANCFLCSLQGTGWLLGPTVRPLFIYLYACLSSPLWGAQGG